MKLDFNVLLFFLISSLSRSVLYARSQYIPRCNINMECEDECNCENVNGCSVLSMNESGRITMLFYHNQIRSLQTNNTPTPGGLVELEYDQELEDISECWAARCSSEYSSCFRTTKFEDTSQSVVQIILDVGETPTLVLWMQMNKIWQMQAKSIEAETVRILPEGKQLKIIHNFAQIVSDRLYSVGCAWSLMERLLTFACTYGPRGPESGEAIYKIGQPCSICPKYFKCNETEHFPQLCKKSNKILITSKSSTHFEEHSHSATPNYKKMKEKFHHDLSGWHFHHSLPIKAPSISPCSLGYNVTHPSELAQTSAPSIPTQTLRTESTVNMNVIQEYLKELLSIRSQLPSEGVKESTQMFTNTTLVSPQSLSSTEYNTKAKSESSAPNWKVDVNINISFPSLMREMLPVRDIFLVKGSNKSAPLNNSMSPELDPDDPDDYDYMATLSTVNQESTHTHRPNARVFRQTTTIGQVIKASSNESNLHDSLYIWRKTENNTSNSSRAKKPTRSKDVTGASVFLFFGVSILFLILGTFLVALLMYILRMEASL